MKEEEILNLMREKECEYELEYDGEKCGRWVAAIYMDGHQSLSYFCESHIQSHLIYGYSALLYTSRETRDLTKNKTIPLILNAAQRCKSNEKKLTIVEEKLNMIYEIIIAED
jgi:hypothetical protein